MDLRRDRNIRSTGLRIVAWTRRGLVYKPRTLQIRQELFCRVDFASLTLDKFVLPFK